MEKRKHSLVLSISDKDWADLFIVARRIKTDRSALIFRFIKDIISNPENQEEIRETGKIAKSYIDKLEEEYNSVIS